MRPPRPQKKDGLPQFRSMPFWAQPCRTTGYRPGVRRKRRQRGHVWIIHRPRSLSESEVGDTESTWSNAVTRRRRVDSRCRATCARVRRTGGGYEWPEVRARDLGDGQRLVWRPAAGARTRNPQVTLDRKFRAADRQKAGQSKGATTRRTSEAARPISTSTTRRRKFTSLTATAPGGVMYHSGQARTNGTGARTANRPTTRRPAYDPAQRRRALRNVRLPLRALFQGRAGLVCDSINDRSDSKKTGSSVSEASSKETRA